MSQQVYENHWNTQNFEENSKNKPQVLKNTTNLRFIILALVLGAVSLIASVSALVAAILLVNNLEKKITKLELQHKALESTNIEQSSLFNNLQDILTKTESKVATLELQNKALESTNNELSSLFNNLQEKLLNGKYEYCWRLRFSWMAWREGIAMSATRYWLFLFTINYIALSFLTHLPNVSVG